MMIPFKDKHETDIPGCFEWKNFFAKDDRGFFRKTYHKDQLKDLGVLDEYPEDFFSLSYKGVFRGFHCQLPPFDHSKIVYCLEGEVEDYVLDLRVNSPMYKKHIKVTLSHEKANALYLPKGVAHGFYVTSQQALVGYKVSKVHSPEHDLGINIKSVLPKLFDSNPTISQRDLSLPLLDTFSSPFSL